MRLQRAPDAMGARPDTKRTHRAYCAVPPTNQAATTGELLSQLIPFANDNRWIQRPTPLPAFGHPLPIRWGEISPKGIPRFEPPNLWAGQGEVRGEGRGDGRLAFTPVIMSKWYQSGGAFLTQRRKGAKARRELRGTGFGHQSVTGNRMLPSLFSPCSGISQLRHVRQRFFQCVGAPVCNRLYAVGRSKPVANRRSALVAAWPRYVFASLR